MLWYLVLVPTVAGLAAFAVPWNTARRTLLLGASLAHAGLTAACLAQRPEAAQAAWIAIDALSLVFLAITTVVFLLAAVYAVGHLARETHRRPAADETPLENSREATFTGCLLLFLAAMTLVILSQHWGLLWVAVEATTLASAPLIHFHRSPRSLEATWKYLVICSVGIALALLGNFFLAAAASGAGATHFRLSIANLEAHARQLDPLWLKAAFLLLLVGYGTKMGLAPLHTWLPDAHSEAPSIVSALLSGALLNCAFLAILRGHALLVRAGLGQFSRELLVLFGLISMIVAGLFIIGQTDYKRLLAYSSVEHMGILALGIGVGGIAGFGSLLHAVNHSLTKAMLFLAAGNTLAAFRTKSTAGTHGVLALLPVTGLIWLAGLLAITGAPPFGMFLSELIVLKGMLDAGRVCIAVLYLAALAAVFAGVSAAIIPMVYGAPPEGDSDPHAPAAPAPGSMTRRSRPQREPLWSVLPLVVLAAAALLLGVYLPPDVSQMLHEAAAAAGAE